MSKGELEEEESQSKYKASYTGRSNNSWSNYCGNGCKSKRSR